MGYRTGTPNLLTLVLRCPHLPTRMLIATQCFALCLQFPALDCLGTFKDHIKKCQPVPVKLSPRTIEKIRLGRFDEEQTFLEEEEFE